MSEIECSNSSCWAFDCGQTCEHRIKNQKAMSNQPPLSEIVAESPSEVIAELFDISVEQATEFINHIKSKKQ